MEGKEEIDKCLDAVKLGEMKKSKFLCELVEGAIGNNLKTPGSEVQNALRELNKEEYQNES